MKSRQSPDIHIVSRELLTELRKDPQYRNVDDQIAFFKSAGAEIAKARKESGLSVSELAKTIGKPESVVRRMERGEYKQYTVKMLLEIARATRMELGLMFRKASARPRR